MIDKESQMGRSARRKQEQRQKGRMSPNHHSLRNRRKKWIVRTLLVLVVVGAIAAWWNGILWGYKQAPSFTLQASNGQLVSLKDYLGKQEVVVIFYMGAG